MVSSVAIQERVENEGFLAAFGGRRRRIGSVGRIEHARFDRSFRVALGRRRGDRLLRSVRRQIEPALASAAPEREHGRAQKNDGPSLTCRAVLADHEKIPNAGRTIQRLRYSGETRITMKLQRNLRAQPNFRCFSSRLSQAFACARTFFGAVPPKLERLFTEASTESTPKTSLVIPGSIACISLSGNSCSGTPAFEAAATMRPVT